MRILRFATPDGARLGVVRGEDIVALEALAGRYPTMRALIAGGDAALDAVRKLAADGPVAMPLADAELLAPIERPAKYLAIGMNYQQHREEAQRAGVATPAKQLWFNKQTTCITGPYDAIDPGVTEKLDYEAELGVVIGKGGKYI
ncbi:2-keto-4-pentenoate hydratase/2-oxohepta-3-ene-1,7-dioic acid hydratase in catechol pathway, partial [Sphingomonas vulcanisoli]